MCRLRVGVPQHVDEVGKFLHGTQRACTADDYGGFVDRVALPRSPFGESAKARSKGHTRSPQSPPNQFGKQVHESEGHEPCPEHALDMATL